MSKCGSSSVEAAGVGAVVDFLDMVSVVVSGMGVLLKLWMLSVNAELDRKLLRKRDSAGVTGDRDW